MTSNMFLKSKKLKKAAIQNQKFLGLLSSNRIMIGLQRQNPTLKTTMKKLFRLCVWTVTTVLVGAGLPGWAADSEGDKPAMPWEKGAIMFGGFVADFSSDLTVGREGGGNRNFNAEDRLN